MSSSANVRHQAGLPPRYHIKIQESFATATAARFGSAARWRTTILFTPPVWLRARAGPQKRPASISPDDYLPMLGANKQQARSLGWQRPGR